MLQLTHVTLKTRQVILQRGNYWKDTRYVISWLVTSFLSFYHHCGSSVLDCLLFQAKNACPLSFTHWDCWLDCLASKQSSLFKRLHI